MYSKSPHPLNHTYYCTSVRISNNYTSVIIIYGSRTRTWKAIGAVHVYKDRPESIESTVTHPSMGFKIQLNHDYHNHGGCGPNYCCCFVPLKRDDMYEKYKGKRPILFG